MLRQTFYQQSKALLSPFMRCGVQCLEDVFSRVCDKPLTGGSRPRSPAGGAVLNLVPHRHHDQAPGAAGGARVGQRAAHACSAQRAPNASRLRPVDRGARESRLRAASHPLRDGGNGGGGRPSMGSWTQRLRYTMPPSVAWLSKLPWIVSQLS
jgi:hypothetical protein